MICHDPLKRVQHVLNLKLEILETPLFKKPNLFQSKTDSEIAPTVSSYPRTPFGLNLSGEEQQKQQHHDDRNGPKHNCQLTGCF